MKKYEIIIFIIITIGFSILAILIESFLGKNTLWLIPNYIIVTTVVLWLYRKNSSHRLEENRVQLIQSMQNNWGKEFCDWLILSGYDPKSPRVYKLAEKIDDWGMITVMHLLNRSIGIGMTTQMTALSLGKPSQVDMREITTSGEKYRWVYGTPRKAALYIWFNDHRVSKIKFSKNIGSSKIGRMVSVIEDFYNQNDPRQDLFAETTPSRERIPDDVQIFVWQRDQGKCVKCGSNENLEYDHIIPLSKGGSNTRRNIQLLCDKCNRSKGAKIGG